MKETLYNNDNDHGAYFSDNKKLAQISRSKLQEWMAINNDKSSFNGEKVFQSTCMKCHGDDAIPGFSMKNKSLSENLQENKELIHNIRFRLDKNTPKNLQMPKNMKFSDDEREAVLKYIEAFNNSGV